MDFDGGISQRLKVQLVIASYIALLYSEHKACQRIQKDEKKRENIYI